MPFLSCPVLFRRVVCCSVLCSDLLRPDRLIPSLLLLFPVVPCVLATHVVSPAAARLRIHPCPSALFVFPPFHVFTRNTTWGSNVLPSPQMNNEWTVRSWLEKKSRSKRRNNAACMERQNCKTRHNRKGRRMHSTISRFPYSEQSLRSMSCSR